MRKTKCFFKHKFCKLRCCILRIILWNQDRLQRFKIDWITILSHIHVRFGTTFIILFTRLKFADVFCSGIFGSNICHMLTPILALHV